MNIQSFSYEESETLIQVKSLQKLIVNKAFEKHNNVISESYFDVSDNEEAISFVEEYAHNLSNGLILVINSTLNFDEVLYFLKGIQSCFKLVISYNYSVYTPDNEYFKKIQTVKTYSINSAASIAYQHLQNNQAILFAYVDSNFDLFGYLD